MREINARITPLPPAPNKANPITFDELADKFVQALLPFGEEINALSLDIQNFSNEFEEVINNQVAQVQTTYQAALVNIQKLRLDTLKAFFDAKFDAVRLLQSSNENTLEKQSSELFKLTEELKERLSAQTAASLESIQQNADTGADYVALSENISHTLSIERVLIQADIIKPSYEEADEDIQSLTSKFNEFKASSEEFFKSLIKGQKIQLQTNEILMKGN